MRLGALAVVAVSFGFGATVAAADPPAIGGAATVTAGATRVSSRAEVVVVNEPSTLSAAVQAAAARAATAAGGAALPGRAAQIDLVRLLRGADVVQQPPSGYRIPMGLTVVPVEAAAFIFDAPVSSTLAAGQVVMGATSAGLRGARAGDVVELVDAGGGTRSFTIGLVAADEAIGGAELMLGLEAAALLGVDRNTRMIIWGFDSRAAIDAALSAQGLPGPKVRVSRGWDPPSPDATLGFSRTKALLGEFAYRRFSDGGLGLQPGWTDANIHPRMTFAGVGVRASCHNVVVPAIQGALQEIADAGLGGLIDLASTNSVGGCFAPRLNNVTGNLGFLSRHTWAQALDINVAQNPQGAAPRLDCRIVRNFRKWGFAWGGNFVNPDGMHFEYVGEPRHLLAFPSAYCPNIIGSSVERVNGHGATEPHDPLGPGWVFADDGLLVGHD
jgi:hypothetical protein